MRRNAIAKDSDSAHRLLPHAQSDAGTDNPHCAPAPIIAAYIATPDVQTSLETATIAQHMRFACLPHPANGLRAWSAATPDLYIVDLFNSLQAPEYFAQLVRRLAGNRPVLALTLHDDVRERITALQYGCDDVMHRAGCTAEMLARAQALLRRNAIQRGVLRCDDLHIDLLSRRVARQGAAIPMPNREYELLLELARTPNQVVSRGSLLHALWRLDFDPGTNRLEVHVSRLRARVDQGFRWPLLHTVKGIGYCLRTRTGAGYLM